MDFSSTVLFVTGGASGIGLATAKRYAKAGGRVVLADKNYTAAKDASSQFDGSYAVLCDVSDEPSVTDAVASAAAKWGRIDHVVNAAGHVEFGPIEGFSLKSWDLMMQTHVNGTFLVCRAALPYMRRSGGGAVVNLASVAALVARPNLGAYSAAKGAILAFSRQLALDASADKVRVNVVAPGSVRTGMTQPLYTQRGGGDYAKGEEMVAQASIQKRVADADEIASAICFLLSNEGAFFTGSMLVPDGGMTAL